MIATHDYVLYSNDMEWLQSIWDGYLFAMTYITAKIDNGTGLLDVTGTFSWGRSASSSGYSTTGNMLMYRALISGSILASWAGGSDLVTEWQGLAAKLKSAVNSPDYNWDPTAG